MVRTAIRRNRNSLTKLFFLLLPLTSDEVGAVESVKAANEIYTPVSGTILEVNGALEEKPGLVNSSCYADGWLFKIKVRDQAEVSGLMDEKAYEAFLKSVQE